MEYAKVIQEDEAKMAELQAAVEEFRKHDAEKAQHRIEYLTVRKDNWVSWKGMHSFALDQPLLDERHVPVESRRAAAQLQSGLHLPQAEVHPAR